MRIEITPKDIFSKKKGDWSYKVDEPESIPDWYQNDPLAQEKIVWKEWQAAIGKINSTAKESGALGVRSFKTNEATGGAVTVLTVELVLPPVTFFDSLGSEELQRRGLCPICKEKGCGSDHK